MQVTARRASVRAAVPLGILLVTTLVAPMWAATRTDRATVDPTGTTPSRWAWTVARQPSTEDYTPAPKDRGNSNGGVNTVHRYGTGQYLATFPNVGFDVCSEDGCYGIVDVTALSDRQRVCEIQDFAIGPGDTNDVTVTDSCRRRSGDGADTAFTASYSARARGRDRISLQR